MFSIVHDVWTDDGLPDPMARRSLLPSDGCKKNRPCRAWHTGKGRCRSSTRSCPQ